jgi:pimeloyl-ACP methyl ester carboxylesterase
MAGLTWSPGPLAGSIKTVLRATARFRRKSVTAGRQRWVYLDGGTGIPLVMIHGYGSDKYPLAGFASRFLHTHRLVVPDLPGFGDSGRTTAQSYRIPVQAERLRRFLAALGIHRCHMMGVSMGGYLAAWYAARYPDQIARLVLMDPAGIPQPILSPAFQAYIDHGINIFDYRNTRELDRLVEFLFYRPPWMPHVVKRYAIARAAARWKIREKTLNDLMADGDGLLPPVLPKITSPCLILWGENDRIIDPSAARGFHRAIAGSRAVVIPECGHVPFLEKPEETYRHIAGFLSAPTTQGAARSGHGA